MPSSVVSGTRSDSAGSCMFCAAPPGSDGPYRRLGTVRQSRPHRTIRCRSLSDWRTFAKKLLDPQLVCYRKHKASTRPHPIFLRAGAEPPSGENPLGPAAAKNVGLQDDLVKMASDRGLTAFLFALTSPQVSDRKPCASKIRVRVGVAWGDSGLPTTGVPRPSLVLQHPGGSGIALTSMASAERAHVSRHN